MPTATYVLLLRPICQDGQGGTKWQPNYNPEETADSQTGEPPMMDCGFVPGDQSLAPTKRANQNLVHKTLPYSLLGHDFPGPALRTREPRPDAQTPIKLCTA